MKTVTVQNACALSRDKFVALTFRAEEEDEDVDAYEILFVEGHGRPTTISRQGKYVSIARVAAARDETALLLRDGIVEYLSFAGESRGREDIIGAITRGETVPPFGFLFPIACIDDQLFACGMGGQVFARDVYARDVYARDVYARAAAGGWTLISPGLRTTDHYARWFSNIQGRDRRRVFADGLDGILYFYDGATWRRVATGTDVAIGEMVFLDADTIYIAGRRSTLLVGNERKGFHPVRVSMRDLDLTTICRYRDDIFIGTEQGLFRLQRSRDGLLPVSGDGIDERDVLSLQVVDDVMWCFGLEFIRRFDGERWERFDHIL